jgi:hypothetical protein
MRQWRLLIADLNDSKIAKGLRYDQLAITAQLHPSLPQPIMKDRVDAVPYARFCTSCAEKLESPPQSTDL